MIFHDEVPIPKVGFNPPSYICKKTSMPLSVIDGNLDKEFWNQAQYTELFTDIEGPSMPQPRFATKAKMLWDENNLYIGAELWGNEIWANQTEHDCVIFYDNDFEIFIDPDSDTQEYVEFEMNANNAYWDLLLTKAYRDHGSPINGLELKGIKTAVKIDGVLNDPSAQNVKWSVEVVIPFETLAECDIKRKPPVPGDYYRLNFSRVQWKIDVENNKYVKQTDSQTGKVLPEDNWVWAPTGVINIHYPELWGFLFFTDSENDSFSIPEKERVKWDLRKLYYAEYIYFKNNLQFSTDINILKDILAKNSPCAANKEITNREYIIETTSTSFEISTFDYDSNDTIRIYSDGKIS